MSLREAVLEKLAKHGYQHTGSKSQMPYKEKKKGKKKDKPDKDMEYSYSYMDKKGSAEYDAVRQSIIEKLAMKGNPEELAPSNKELAMGRHPEKVKGEDKKPFVHGRYKKGKSHNPGSHGY